jgi:hypothetical protein
VAWKDRIFLGSALLSWALGIVFSLIMSFPMTTEPTVSWQALTVDLQVDAVLLGFAVIFFVFFLRGEMVRVKERIPKWTFWLATSFWSFFWSFLFGFNLILRAPSNPVDWVVIPLGFTVAGVFAIIVFLIQIIVLHKEKDSSSNQTQQHDTIMQIPTSNQSS